MIIIIIIIIIIIAIIIIIIMLHEFNSVMALLISDVPEQNRLELLLVVFRSIVGGQYNHYCPRVSLAKLLTGRAAWTIR